MKKSDAEKQIEVLKYALRETLWMARRYATLRSTYAPKMYNEVVHNLDAVELGYLAPRDPIGEMDSEHPGGRYAWDGMFGAWDESLRSFVKDERWETFCDKNKRFRIEDK
jgi:hypothetical protein